MKSILIEIRHEKSGWIVASPDYMVVIRMKGFAYTADYAYAAYADWKPVRQYDATGEHTFSKWQDAIDHAVAEVMRITDWSKVIGKKPANDETGLLARMRLGKWQSAMWYLRKLVNFQVDSV